MNEYKLLFVVSEIYIMKMYLKTLPGWIRR